MSRALQKADVTGLVLAGGRGSRMGSIDKGLLPFRGKPLFLHASQRLSPQVATLLLNANRNPEEYEKAGFEVIPDDPLTFSGPLSGFATGLKYCRTPYLVTIPCDSPFFPETLVKTLGEALLRENADIAIAATGGTPPFTPQPVFCLMKRELLPHLLAFLETGKRKIDAWYASLNVVLVPFTDEAAFCNINTPDEVKKLENYPEK